MNSMNASQDQIANSLGIAIKYDIALQAAYEKKIQKEKMSLVTRLAEIAYTRGEMTWTTAIDFYMGKSRNELRAIMRTVKGIFHLSHLAMTEQTISQLDNWIKNF